ncbi:Jouberin [Acipenser ruthenus]|uniref:Jouberin n=1 Tax=Acipenser ruthenus TaxID=7906 RepID=A0A662YVH5_ACIRT|nr:Jouberin [Acipenser ruthenus]
MVTHQSNAFLSSQLETLKNSLDLKKGDDKTILNNTYNQEEGSPRFTKNKLREKTLTTEKVNNNALTEEERQPAKTKKKKKKKDVTEDQGQYEDPQYIISTSAERDDTHTTKVAKSKTNLEADETRQKPERRKAKNASRVPPELSKDEEEEDEQLFQRYQQQIAEEEAKEIKKKLRKKIAETMSDYTVNTTNQVLNNEVEKKKKKKTVPVTTEGEISAMSLSELQDSQTEELIRKKKKHRITTSDTERVEEDGEQILKEEEAQQKAEAKKRKKKRKKAEVNEELNDNATAAEAQPSRHLFDDNLVLGVYVHRTDRLKTDLMVSHPMVKVHVIDEMTGQYVRKEKSGRPVSSFYEQETVDHILPIMTQPYDFKKNKSTVPEWDEQIIFNERFGYFVQETEESPKVMLFFEVLDFMSMDEARANFEIQRHESGFRKIAWAFLKEIQEIDLKGVPVNHLEVHPNGRRLLIHAKDRDQVAVYSELCYSSPLRDVAFHPHEHMVALCAFGPNLPVHVYLYDRKIALMEAESMKELSGSRVTTVPKGPRILSSTSDDPTLQDSTMSSMDRFASAARISLNLQRVKQKLDSVLVPMHKNQSTMEYLYEQPGIVPSMTKNLTQEASVISPGSSNYLHTVGSNLSLPAPSLLSPHSKLRLPSTLGAQLIPQQSSHNGGFSPVGQRFSHAPSLRLQTSIANPSASFLRVEADTFIPVQQTVVALYDYTANRSDELTIHRGEIIQVLYKDNDNWWFGRLANGQQGYFPANYVADERGFEEELSHTLESNPALSDKQHETEERSPTPTKMSAVISKSGKFKIISENDTDTESPVILIQKKKKKKKAVGSGSEAPVLAPEPLQPTDVVEQSSTEVVRKKRLKAPHKHSDASGETNVAFEPDF